MYVKKSRKLSTESMKVVEVMGDGANLLRYRVDGMDCPSCAGKIETAVGRVLGAQDIRVNYQRQTLAFRLDEAATPRAAVEEGIRKLGYGAAPFEAPRVLIDGGHSS